ncbi:MAG: hypothetical protein L3J04_00610 [Robiginitomaculum sp.]|nr:hypothetical protein [Robiginitomaculum sp.]
MTSKIYKIHWCGIEIEACYKPRDFGGSIAHPEIKSINPPRAPLPMTETGYKSHFHPIGTIEKIYDGDVVACVIDWLDKEAQSKTWKEYAAAARQGELFKVRQSA